MYSKINKWPAELIPYKLDYNIHHNSNQSIHGQIKL